jgi:hypothetical protein
MNDQPLMRVYICYASPWRRHKLERLKAVLVQGVPILANPHLLQLVWNLLHSNKKVSMGYEYVTLLMRFGAGTSSADRTGRLTPWNFNGVYQALPQTSDADLDHVHFMTKYARRDRSVRSIRLPLGAVSMDEAF